MFIPFLKFSYDEESTNTDMILSMLPLVVHNVKNVYYILL